MVIKISSFTFATSFLFLQKILAGKIPKKVDIKPLRYLVKIEKPKPRPPTPSVEGPSPVSLSIFVLLNLH